MELDLGNVAQKKRKWQNYFAKSEACASSSQWKAEFQHLLRLLIFFRFAVPKSVRCLQLSETCCVGFMCFEYMYRGVQRSISWECGEQRVPVMFCSPIQGCMLAPQSKRWGKLLQRGREDQGAGGVTPLGCGMR